MFRFRNLDEIEEILLSSIETSHIIQTDEKDCVKYFHNGDEMIVNTKTGDVYWDTTHPGQMSSSKINLRIHQWIEKGIIYVVPESEGKS